MMSSLSRWSAIAALSLVCGQLTVIPSARANSEVDLYQLCSSFPHNSRCKGYEAPVALKARKGIEGVCLLKLDTEERKGACKLDVQDSEITLYQEFGSELAVLNNQRATRSLTLDPKSIRAIEYRQGKKVRAGALIANTLLFGVAGALFTRPKKFAEIKMDSMGDLQNVSSGATTPPKISFTGVFEQDKGMELRYRLEKITGQPAQTPEDKDEKDKK